MYPHSAPGIVTTNHTINTADRGSSTIRSNGIKPVGRAQFSSTSLSPAQVCRFHQRGKCTKGRSCTFSHNLNEQPLLAPTFAPPFKSFDPPVSQKEVKSTMPCRYFQSGTCREGSLCNYSHQAPENQIAPLINSNNGIKSDVGYISKTNPERAEAVPENIVSSPVILPSSGFNRIWYSRSFVLLTSIQPYWKW